ncbi:MAG: histidinol-phosphatase [Clostridia bacterium]|nr:histidinol-phosphatase [Clostridia bacterium]
MLKANYHTHTFRCMHAAGEDREYVEAAIKAGIRVLGCSDHTPYVGFDGDYYSGFRMRPEALEDYVNSVNSLKEEYKDRIEIHLGLEAEYYPRLFEGFLRFIEPYGIEYLILGQHFPDSDQYGCYAPYINDAETAEKYVNQCIEAMETGLFSYVAHPDIFGLDRSLPQFLELSEKYCRAAKALDIPLELNFLGLSQNRLYPCEEFFAVAGKVGNKIIYGRDAHNPNVFFDRETEERADEVLKKYSLERMENIDITRLSRYFSGKK